MSLLFVLSNAAQSWKKLLFAVAPSEVVDIIFRLQKISKKNTASQNISNNFVVFAPSLEKKLKP